MPTTVEVQKMFRYSAWPMQLTLIALIAVTLLLILLFLLRFLKNKREGRKNTIKSILWEQPDIEKLRQEYLARLMKIEMEFDADNTRIRPSYEQMSVLVRDFVFKATGIDVPKYTLSELRSTDLHELTDLIEEYYEPEFDKISAGDVKTSIGKTRQVISRWN